MREGTIGAEEGGSELEGSSTVGEKAIRELLGAVKVVLVSNFGATALPASRDETIDLTDGRSELPAPIPSPPISISRPFLSPDSLLTLERAEKADAVLPALRRLL